jgi:hypothetical protein
MFSEIIDRLIDRTHPVGKLGIQYFFFVRLILTGQPCSSCVCCLSLEFDRVLLKAYLHHVSNVFICSATSRLLTKIFKCSRSYGHDTEQNIDRLKLTFHERSLLTYPYPICMIDRMCASHRQNTSTIFAGKNRERKKEKNEKNTTPIDEIARWTYSALCYDWIVK